MMRKERNIVFALILLSGSAFGQKDTTDLNSIVIKGKGDGFFFTKSSDMVSSSSSNMLRKTEGVYIKEGNGKMLSSVRIAGASAAQTAAVWNGLTLNNPLNGQIDLSLVPAGLMNMAVSSLGSSYFGSNSLMGAIVLEQARFDSQTLVDLNFGSFGSKNMRVAKGFKFKKASHYLSIGAHHSLNNYGYTNLIAQPEQRKLENAQAKLFNLLYGTDIKLSDKFKVEGNLWFNNSSRGLPTIASVPTDSAFQKDEAWRGQLAVKYKYRKWETSISSAIGIENLRFVIPKTGLRSYYKTLQQVAKLNARYTVDEHFQLRVSANSNLQNALSFFGESKNINSIGSKLGLLFQKNGWASSINASLRAYSIGFNPFNYNLYIRKQLKKWSFGINHGTSFRAPTLNDLYWPNSGNLNLKPEECVSQAASVGFKNSVGKEGFIKLSASTKVTQFRNQIIWVLNSSSQFWSPINYIKSYHLAHTLKAKTFYRIKHFGNHFFANVSNIRANQVGFLAKEGQLAYTPKFLLNGGYKMTHKKTAIGANVQYQSATFLDTDNLKRIAPFVIANIEISHQFKAERIKAYLTINNALNKTYEITQGRPMAPRNLTLGITLKL